MAINTLIIVALICVIIWDYRTHTIPNILVATLTLFGLFKAYQNSGIQGIIIGFVTLIGMFLIVFATDYIREQKKGAAMMGGGDLKLIACFAVIFGIPGLLLCLVIDLIYEYIYRYIIHTDRKIYPLPLGMPLGLAGIALVTINIVWVVT